MIVCLVDSRKVEFMCEVRRFIYMNFERCDGLSCCPLVSSSGHTFSSEENSKVANIQPDSEIDSQTIRLKASVQVLYELLLAHCML